MRSYRNVVLDLIEGFEECEFSLIPRLQNGIADSLTTSTMVFKIPIHPNRKYEVEVKHRPSIPDNVKKWQVFEDDRQIQSFLHLMGDFEDLIIEVNDSPPDAVSQSKEADLNQSVLFEEESHDRPVFPTEAAIKDIEVGQPDSQESDE